MVYASEYGISANSNRDQTEAINSAIADATARGETLIFEDGTYIVSGDVLLENGSRIQSENVGGAAFKSLDPDNSAVVTNGGWSGNTITTASVKGFVMDDVTVDFTGRVNNIEIAENAFINTSDKVQIETNRGEHHIHDNVLLRGPEDQFNSDLVIDWHGGRTNVYNQGIYTYNDNGTLIENNVVGGLNDSLANSNYHSASVKQLFDAVTSYDSSVDLYDSGYYTNGIYLSNKDGEGTQVIGNTVVGVVDADEMLGRDHALYAIPFDNIVVADNYFAGWPEDSSGGVKIRNGDGLEFYNNHLDGLSLITYAYIASGGDLHFKDADIYNNTITSANPAISYWENGKGTVIENVKIHDNVLVNTNGGPDISLMPALNDEFGVEGAYGIELYNNETPDGGEVTLRLREGLRIATDENDQILTTNGDDFLNGHGGDDFLDGLEGDDVLAGGAGNDSIQGGKGNDTLIGGAGDDKLYGNVGVDTAVFEGNLSKYSISQGSDGVTVIGDGTDFVANSIERLEFADQVLNRVDINEYFSGSISGRYFDDANANGVQDAGEAGIADTQVYTRLGSDGRWISTRTDENGEYSFSNLAQGDYVVRFASAGDEYAFSEGNVGSNDRADSDVVNVWSSGTGVSSTINLAQGQSVADLDAGAYRTDSAPQASAPSPAPSPAPAPASPAPAPAASSSNVADASPGVVNPLAGLWGQADGMSVDYNNGQSGNTNTSLVGLFDPSDFGLF